MANPISIEVLKARAKKLQGEQNDVEKQRDYQAVIVANEQTKLDGLDARLVAIQTELDDIASAIDALD